MNNNKKIKEEIVATALKLSQESLKNLKQLT